MSLEKLRELQLKQPSSRSDSSNRLIPVTKWSEHHDWPPIGGLRHLIFNAQTNGFAPAFKRVGRRVLIDEKAFFECVDRQNQRGA